MSAKNVSSEEVLGHTIAALGEAHVALIVALHTKGVLSLSEARDVLELSCELRRPSGNAELYAMSERVLRALIERIEREIASLSGDDADRGLRMIDGGKDDQG